MTVQGDLLLLSTACTRLAYWQLKQHIGLPAAAAAADAALAAPLAAEAAEAAAAPPFPADAAEAAAAPCNSLRDTARPSLMSHSAPESKRRGCRHAGRQDIRPKLTSSCNCWSSLLTACLLPERKSANSSVMLKTPLPRKRAIVHTNDSRWQCV